MWRVADIDNQYDLYSRRCADGSSMLEIVDFTISYASVAIIKSLRIIILIASAELLIMFILDIYNAFQNNILPYSKERDYHSLPRFYLEWLKIKRPKYILASINPK